MTREQLDAANEERRRLGRSELSFRVADEAVFYWDSRWCSLHMFLVRFIPESTLVPKEHVK